MTRAEAIGLIEQNRSAYTSSRNLVVAVGVASVLLALLLGYILARSVVAPIELTEERLEGIASGNFSTHLDVPNRDELGALAANVNRMNDELGRLYAQLESQAAELAGWNKTLEARVDEQVQELRASRSRVVLAADAERRRIERDLHDGAQQHLIALALQLRLARELAGSEPDKAEEILGAWTPRSSRHWSAFAISRTASIRRCSRIVGSLMRSRLRPSEHRLQHASRHKDSVAIRPTSRQPSTSAALKRFRTPRSTPAMAHP